MLTSHQAAMCHLIAQEQQGPLNCGVDQAYSFFHFLEVKKMVVITIQSMIIASE